MNAVKQCGLRTQHVDSDREALARIVGGCEVLGAQPKLRRPDLSRELCGPAGLVLARLSAVAVAVAVTVACNPQPSPAAPIGATVQGCPEVPGRCFPASDASDAGLGPTADLGATIDAEVEGTGGLDVPFDGRPPPIAVADAGVSVGMVRVPAGEFTMGSNQGDEDEKPVHLVTMASFELDSTEVAMSDYQRCVAAGACTPAGRWKLCNFGEAGRENHPINCVEWKQAAAFCGWLGKRLPTEEEWEYAARGTDQRAYPWGNEAPDGRVCWRRYVTRQGTCEVGSLPIGDSPFGLHDMAGNVWEWTSSGRSKDYRSKRETHKFVVRGASWGDVNPINFRAAERGSEDSRTGSNIIGFRCAR